ncbi:hypothetical protein BLA29_002613, partial [Euroglyphus maynei]
MMITRGGDKMSYKSSRKLLENCLKICIKPQLREHLGSSIKTRELQTILVHGKCRSSLVHFVNDALARIAHSSTQTMIMHVSMNRLIESRNSLVNMFKVASKMNPCIICFEDIDRFMNDSELPKLVGNLARLFDQFIDFVHELEGDNDNEDIVIIGITNLVNSLHPSISQMSRKHSKVSNNRRVQSPLPSASTVEKSDKMTSTAKQMISMGEKSMAINNNNKLEKSSRIVRKQNPTQPRLFKRQPTTAIVKHQGQSSQPSSKKWPKNSTVKLVAKRRQSTTVKSSLDTGHQQKDDDSLQKRLSMKKTSAIVTRNKQIQTMEKKTNDDNCRMHSLKPKRQRDDSKQTVVV